MKKSHQLILMLAFLLGLSACPSEQKTANQITNDNKNIVNVNIDEKLLEALRGKVGEGDPPNEDPNPDQEPRPNEEFPEIPEPEPDLEIDAEAEHLIYQVIDDNANALNTQDLEFFASTLHPESEFTAYMPDVFYLLLQAQTRYNILEKELRSLSENSASVVVFRRTSDLSGTIDQEILYSMRKDGPDWKIFFMTDQTGYSDYY